MTGLLLDTHVLLWWLDDPTRLTEDARARIARRDTAVFVSSAAAWEMAIKKALGRLDYPPDLEAALTHDHIDILPIAVRHALAVADLPPHHSDPFDRMHVAQAQLEGLTLVTRDEQLTAYDVRVLRA